MSLNIPLFGKDKGENNENDKELNDNKFMDYGMKNDSTQVPYHEAKNIIQNELKSYTENIEDGLLPEIEFKRKDKKTEIKFKYKEDTTEKIIGNLAELTGGIKVSGNENHLRLDYENGVFNLHIYEKSSIIDGSFSLNKDGDLTSNEIDAILNSYKIGNPVDEIIDEKTPKEVLEQMGATVYETNNDYDWDMIAGYEDVKQEIKNNVILPLENPGVYKKIAEKTRKNYESSRPRAVLFEGPPGTGKTTSARIISSKAENPMIYVPIESIMTKWYGQSSRNLAKVFDNSRKLGDSLLFLDEIDSLATSRENNMYEATRRVLSVLLRKIDGFETYDNSILIGATNRKDDLDPALLSRFDTNINFHLPDKEERKSIFENYAQHLDDLQLEKLAEEYEGVSGRKIKDICEHSERAWASKILTGKVDENSLPSFDVYLESTLN